MLGAQPDRWIAEFVLEPSIVSGGSSRALGGFSKCREGVTNGIVLEVLIGSLEPPINGLACRSAEDARLVPQAAIASLVVDQRRGWRELRMSSSVLHTLESPKMWHDRPHARCSLGTL